MATTLDKGSSAQLCSSNLDKPIVKQRRLIVASQDKPNTPKKQRTSSKPSTKKMPPSSPSNPVKREIHEHEIDTSTVKTESYSETSNSLNLNNLPPEYVMYYAQLQQQMAALAALSAFGVTATTSSPDKQSLSSPLSATAGCGPPHTGGSGTDSSRDANTPLSEAGSLDTSGGSALGVTSKKNYKSLTRERRVEANARERTRVHTISAAFESLRKSIPSYTSSQKLSKLAILRIACRYIESLATLLDLNYGVEEQPLDFSSCVHELNETISAESKVRRN